MNPFSISCWTKRRKLLLLIAALLNVAFFLIYDYRHSDRYKTLRKTSIQIPAAFEPSELSDKKPVKKDRLDLFPGKLSPYYKSKDPFPNQNAQSFSGGGRAGQEMAGVRYKNVRPTVFVRDTTPTSGRWTTKNQSEMTSAETMKLANETLATLLITRKKPRPNMDMNLFLKTSGWLERQMVNANVYVYNNVLDSPGVCPERGNNLTLLVTVLTSVQNLAQRMAIRDTWGKDLKKMGARIVFFLGMSTSPAVQDLARRECSDYNDLVQEDFVDSYYNLSTKTISMLKWVSLNCPKAKFVLKSDDDIYVNAPALMQRLETLNDTTAIYGLLGQRWRPIRYKKSKWYVPFRNYPWAHYPDFVVGPAYILVGSAVPRLFQVANRMKPFFLEDVYVTGLVALVAGIPRIDQRGMKNSRDTFNPCSFNKTITSHSHPSWDLRRRHRAILSKRFICRLVMLSDDTKARSYKTR